MIEKLNSRMLREVSLVKEAALVPELEALVDGGVRKEGDAFLLQGLGVVGIERGDFADATGFEALANKIHIEDFTPAALDACAVLAQGLSFTRRLAGQLDGGPVPFRLVLSAWPSTSDVTFRLLARRHNELWGPEDPEMLREEAVGYWDVGGVSMRLPVRHETNDG